MCEAAHKISQKLSTKQLLQNNKHTTPQYASNCYKLTKNIFSCWVTLNSPVVRNTQNISSVN